MKKCLIKSIGEKERDEGKNESERKTIKFDSHTFQLRKRTSCGNRLSSKSSKCGPYLISHQIIQRRRDAKEEYY